MAYVLVELRTWGRVFDHCVDHEDQRFVVLFLTQRETSTNIVRSTD